MSALPCNPAPAHSLETNGDAAPVSTPDQTSYNQILKSTAWVGGSSVINILIGIVRTKAMAILLGPSGFGLAGLYGSISDLAYSIAGMGINNSGVRQIAEAVGTSDQHAIARTAHVLRRTSLALGLAGVFLLLLFSRPASKLTFGTTSHTGAISLLSIAVFFRLLASGQGALIQGTRRVSDLAKMNVLGALFGTVLTIPIIYLFREHGVVPSLIVVAASSLATSWWYSRKITLSPASLTAGQIRQHVTALLKLGVAFMASGLMMMGSAYVARIIILQTLGIEATGLYQAAWTLGGLYVGFILQAMGADFYPRLTAAATNHVACNRLVNEQAHMGLLLSGPGLIATLTFAPLVLALFYSAKFSAAVEVLRWICLGAALRVVTWPMGFIIVAKGKQGLFFWSELVWTILNIGLTWLFVRLFGLTGAGIAFLGSYLLHGPLIFLAVRRLTGFRWSSNNTRTACYSLLLTLTAFCAASALTRPWALSIGLLSAFVSGLYSLRTLATIVSLEKLPSRFQTILVRLGLVTRPAVPAN